MSRLAGRMRSSNRFALALLVGLAPPIIGTATANSDEAAVEACLCRNMDRQVRVDSGAFADCRNGSHAIEIDPTHKWAEAIGQSLHYAEQLNLRATIYLYCAWGVSEAQCYRHQLRLESTVAAHSLPIEVRYFVESEVLKGDCPPARATE